MSKKELLKKGKTFIVANGRYPTNPELIAMGMARTTMRDQFGNLAGYLDELYKESRNLIFDLNKENIKDISTKKNKTFIITTAVTGDKVEPKALASINTFCKKFNAKLIVHVAKGKKALGQTLDPALRNYDICLKEINLNTNVKLIPVFQSSGKSDPASGGLPRTGKRDSSIIVASPKQRLLYTATGIDKLPHAIMGTGAITRPAYERTAISGYMAEYDHVMGAVIVEIKNDEIFHFRQVQFDEHGGFVDLGTYVRGNKITKMKPSAMVLGDWHSGKCMASVVNASKTITTQLGIPRWILHDIFDGGSVSHHNEGKLLLLAMKAGKQELNLDMELNNLTQDLKWMTTFLKEIVIVKSNHDEHLERYLDEGRFMKDPANTELSITLAGAMLKGNSPVQYYVEQGLKSDKLIWLKRDESYMIAGIECGAHGDKGANGSKGSIGSLEKAFGDCVFGHAHTPQILRGAWCVGTTTDTHADYGAGPSSWMNTHCLVYPNGSRQMINFIQGEFTIRDL